jgi:hypothetical protein
MISLNINGAARSVDVEPNTPLLWVIRDTLGLIGTKYGCGMGAVRRLHRPRRRRARALVQHARLRGGGQEDRDDRSRRRDADRQARPGRMGGAGRAAVRLLPGRSDHGRRGAAAREGQAHDADIDQAMEGNICRCGTYPRIRAAIHKAGREQGVGHELPDRHVPGVNS